MGSMGKNTVLYLEEDDEYFLSQVASLEAEALSAAKRRKITVAASSAAASSPKLEATAAFAADEGAYTAALRGSRSILFQQQIAGPGNALSKVVASDHHGSSSGSAIVVGGGDSCFKCGKSGHWARDCNSCSSDAASSDVPDKACPCGVGICKALTANTEKNRGRKFYKCPQREENGGCGYFEWCDKNKESGYAIVNSQSHAPNPSASVLSCPCGAGSCLILTAKTEKNLGKQFYRCPANQSCGFFKWCDDGGCSFSISVNASASYNTNKTSRRISADGTGSSCFKCGQGGHWAKDCSQK